MAELGLLKEDENALAVHNSQQELQCEDVPSPNSTPIWRVPHRRNPFFIGRDAILTQLHDMACRESIRGVAPILAISGIGGIGKTQTAVEYAHRFHCDYQTTLWLQADTRDILITEVISVANELGIPQQQDYDQVIKLIKDWLSSHTGWLMILDNVEDFTVVPEEIFTDNASVFSPTLFFVTIALLGSLRSSLIFVSTQERQVEMM